MTFALAIVVAGIVTWKLAGRGVTPLSRWLLLDWLVARGDDRRHRRDIEDDVLDEFSNHGLR